MARIIPLQTVLTFNQYATEKGDFYPCAVYVNDGFIENFESSLIIANTIIEPLSELSLLIDSVLKGLSDYKVWREKQANELPDEIMEHFGLLPSVDSTISMPFKALNSLPGEVLLYSYDEVRGITEALRTAAELLERENDLERLSIVKPMADSFSDFLTSWDANRENTGTYFAEQKTR